jgi:hypothetical protein
MLPKGGDLQRLGVVVLLSQGCDALRAEVLSERHRLHRRETWTVRLSCRNDTLWERGESDVLSRWAGVRLGLSPGVVVRHRVRLRERHDLDDEHDDGLNLIVIDEHQLVHKYVDEHDQHQHEYLDDGRDLHGR